MRIGIVTPAFNVAPYIGDAIRSVLAQTHQAWSMTIVDDGSADQTAVIAAGFDDPRIRLIRQHNAGVSAARNRGLAATNAETVLFLDADDWLSADALSVLAATLRAAPGAIAAVGPYRLVADGKPVPGSRVSRPESGDLLEALLVRNLFANGGHLLIRRHALDAAGRIRPQPLLWRGLGILDPNSHGKAHLPASMCAFPCCSRVNGMTARIAPWRPGRRHLFRARMRFSTHRNFRNLTCCAVAVP